jgi:hypothetical protein
VTELYVEEALVARPEPSIVRIIPIAWKRIGVIAAAAFKHCDRQTRLREPAGCHRSSETGADYNSVVARTYPPVRSRDNGAAGCHRQSTERDGTSDDHLPSRGSPIHCMSPSIAGEQRYMSTYVEAIRGCSHASMLHFHSRLALFAIEFASNSPRSDEKNENAAPFRCRASSHSEKSGVENGLAPTVRLELRAFL